MSKEVPVPWLTKEPWNAAGSGASSGRAGTQLQVGGCLTRRLPDGADSSAWITGQRIPSVPEESVQYTGCLLLFFFFFTFTFFLLNTPDFESPAVSFLPCSVGVQPADDSSLMAPCVCERAHERGGERCQTENPQGLSSPGEPTNHCSDWLLTEHISHPRPLKGTRSPSWCALDTHTHTRLLQVKPTADLRLLQILPGRRNVSFSLALRLEAGQRITRVFLHSSKNLQDYRQSWLWFTEYSCLRMGRGNASIRLTMYLHSHLCMSGNYLNQATSSLENHLKLFSLATETFWSLYIPQVCFQR